MQTIRTNNLPSKIGIALVATYRNLFSGKMLHACKYFPSCSAYAIESIKSRGLFVGILKATLRVLRCNPFSKGGFDPVG